MADKCLPDPPRTEFQPRNWSPSDLRLTDLKRTAACSAAKSLVSNNDTSTLESVERDHILRVLEETKWIVAGPTGAAARLGMKRTTLQAKMRESFARHRSVIRVFLRAFSPTSVIYLRESVQFPDWRNITQVHRGSHIP
jgi:regulatory Fis family protein